MRLSEQCRGRLSWLPFLLIVSFLVFRALGPHTHTVSSDLDEALVRYQTSIDPDSGLRSAYLMRNWQQGGLGTAVNASQDQTALLRAHFDHVLQRLVNDTEQSLAKALDRLRLHHPGSWTATDRERWYERLRDRRFRNIHRLAEYRNRGRFPQNEQYDHATPIFVDGHGTACAVGYLMCRSGHAKAVRAIAQSDNLVYVTDTDSSALQEWVLHSGLTQEEAALIQPSYFPPLEHTLSDLIGKGSDQEGALLYDNFSFEVSGTGQTAGPMNSGVETRSVIGMFRSPDFIRIGSHFDGQFAVTDFDQSLRVTVGYDVTTNNDQLIDRIDLHVSDERFGRNDLFGVNWAHAGGSLTLEANVLAEGNVLGTIKGEAADNQRLVINDWLTFLPQKELHVENTWILDGPALATAFVNGIHLSPDLTVAICDIDGNGICDIEDLEQLMAAIHQGSQDLQFDVTEDQRVNSDDFSYWLDVKHVGPGDANLDFYFDSSDLVQVFRAGEYEDEIPGNSTWSTGDWYLDGDFTSADLTRAFRSGRYESGPRAALPAVPEPSGCVAVIGSLLFALTQRRRNMGKPGNAAA